MSVVDCVNPSDLMNVDSRLCWRVLYESGLCAWCNMRLVKLGARGKTRFCQQCKNALTNAKGALHRHTNLSPDAMNLVMSYLSEKPKPIA